ncbi:hypothetical protein SAMN02745116_02357 [Pilibacter termitis]|uniref:Homologous-pairing protein 2 winged helix domain-containing protein n=1 Tax=Pilibacter termitis TaxID=263852 RepID=A0A1T4QYB9_9ENTE|nr:MarR family transcriptional regulator [Pilibacter termitis]SKA08358.1 hypothetical protein SAMN02745116_02357 [Pilibacter termitis]
MNVQEKVLEVLKNSTVPLKSGEVSKIAEIDTKEVAKAIKALKETGEVTSPKRCYYEAKK